MFGGNQSSLGSLDSVAQLAGDLTGNSTINTFWILGQLAGGLLGVRSQDDDFLGNLLSEGLKCNQNEQCLMQEKWQRYLLRNPTNRWPNSISFN